MSALKLSHLSAFEEWYDNHVDSFPAVLRFHEAKDMARRAYMDGRSACDFATRAEELRAETAERKWERLATAVHFSLLEFRSAEEAHAGGDTMEAATRYRHAIERLVDEYGLHPADLKA